MTGADIAKQKILSKYNPEHDTLKDSPKKSQAWTKVDNTAFEWSHSRPLPNIVAQRAIDYINVVVSEYPFQLRYTMAKPLWERFAQVWCETGDEQASMRAI